MRRGKVGLDKIYRGQTQEFYSNYRWIGAGGDIYFEVWFCNIIWVEVNETHLKPNTYRVEITFTKCYFRHTSSYSIYDGSSWHLFISNCVYLRVIQIITSPLYFEIVWVHMTSLSVFKLGRGLDHDWTVRLKESPNRWSSIDWGDSVEERHQIILSDVRNVFLWQSLHRLIIYSRFIWVAMMWDRGKSRFFERLIHPNCDWRFYKLLKCWIGGPSKCSITRCFNMYWHLRPGKYIVVKQGFLKLFHWRTLNDLGSLREPHKLCCINETFWVNI